MPTNNPEDLVETFFRAFNRGDVDAVIALYEPNAVLMAQPGQAAQGAEALRAALNGFFTLKPTLTLEKKKLVMAGDIALSVAMWTLRGTGPSGEAVQMSGTASDVLRKQADGSWLFVIDNPWGTAILD